jgi:hypothetical protein
MTSRRARYGAHYRARLALLGFAALTLGVAAIPLAGSSAHAFTVESLSSPNSDGSKFGDSDDQGRRGTQLGGPGGPVVQFGGSTAQSMSPFARPGYGFAPTPRPPEPYAMPNNN